MGSRTVFAGVVVLAGAAWGPATPLGAQDATERELRPGSSIEVRPARQYPAGWLHRLLLGDLNRELWDTPVHAEVLDLGQFAGGLTPVERGGGQQTRSLRLRAADGRVFTFRSLDKNASAVLDPILRSSLAATVLQDQVAALFPLSALVVAPLLEAAGVLHADPQLVVMPRDPRLGEFQEFAGVLGWIEVRPDEGPDGEPGFAGSTDIIGSEAFLDRLEANPEDRVDARAFLRARLMDFYVSDWDRHPDQWRWAAFGEGQITRWEPVPRDRDWALAHIDGLGTALGRRAQWPHYLGFDREYPSAFGLSWAGRALDRQLLSSLDVSDFGDVVEEVTSRITDAVIDEAVGRLPDTYPTEVVDELRAGLIARRDALGDVALEFYRLLAGSVDVWVTDEPEYALVEVLGDGRVGVTVTELRRGRVPDPNPHFERVFQPGETDEVRIYLRGADDSVEVVGDRPPALRLRILGGGGDDAFIDRTPGTTVTFYDDRGDNTFLPGPEGGIDESEYEPRQDESSSTHLARYQDWGSRWFTYPLVGADSDVGLFVGQSIEHRSYGFRHYPWSSRFRLNYALNPVRMGVRAAASWDVAIGRRGLHGSIGAEGTTREVGWFFGAGNETVDSVGGDFFRDDRASVSVGARLGFEREDRLSLEVGPSLWHSAAVDRDNPTFAEVTRDPESRRLTQAGVIASFELDLRESPGVSGKGFRFGGEFRAVPAILDTEEGYSTIRGDVSGSLPLGPAMASARVGAGHMFGEAPYFEAQRVGGAQTVRGFEEGRFAGRSALWGGAQLRTPLTSFFLLFPATLGVHGVVDVGRVFQDGEDSDELHVGYGGGLWLSLVRPDLLVGATLVDSVEGLRAYLTIGFPY